MRKIITLLFVAPVFFLAEAQDSTRMTKREIGINTNFIVAGFISGNGIPFDFMYKKSPSDRTALRMGVSVHATHTFTPSYPVNYSTTENYGASLILGKEFRVSVGNRWVFYYGGDVMPTFSYRQEGYTLNQPFTSNLRTTEFGTTLRPFLGIRFNINSRLYLATESLWNSAPQSFEPNGKLSMGSSQLQPRTNGRSVCLLTRPVRYSFSTASN